MSFDDRAAAILGGTYTFDAERNAGGGGGGLGDPVGGFLGGGSSPYDGLAAEQVEVARTSSGLVNGLQQQLLSLGIMPEAINEISTAVARMPRRTQMQLVMQAQEAQNDGDALATLLYQLDGWTVSPLMDVDVTQPRHDIGQAILDLEGFDSREARAALRANSDSFDATLAGTVLQLTGYSQTEANAMLNGDTTGLQLALDEALVSLGLFRGAADEVLNPVGASGRPIIDTGNGVTNRLGISLQELGLADQAIEDILQRVARMPARRQTSIAIDAERALTDTSVLTRLLGEFDDMTPHALIGVEGGPEVRRRVGEGLLELHDFAGREAVAALQVGTEGFDRPFARSVLELNGFSDREATALLRGDPTELQDELNAAILDLGLYGRRRETATIAAEGDERTFNQVARQLGNVADPYSGAGNPGGVVGRRARITAVDRNAVEVNERLNAVARNRTSTIFVRTVQAFADGGIRGDYRPVPAGTGVAARAAAGRRDGSSSTTVNMTVVPERLVPSLGRVMRQAGASPVPSGPIRESML